MVRNSSKPYAFISTRDHLEYEMLRFGKKLFHIPPQTEDSTVYFGRIAIAMQKEFQHKKEFNKLYVILFCELKSFKIKVSESFSASQT